MATKHDRTDEWAFVLVILFGLLIAMQGKSIAEHIFTGSDNWIRERGAINHALCALVAGCFGWVRSSNFSLKLRVLTASAIAFIGVTAIHVNSSGASVLVYCLQLLLLIFAVAVVAVERDILHRNFEPSFWKLILDAAFRVIRYVLMLYVAGFALLKFLSDGIREDRLGFLTSFVYPTVVVVYGLFIVVYWLALPAWENLVRSHELQPLIHSDLWARTESLEKEKCRALRQNA